jgi:hypothetical protein
VNVPGFWPKFGLVPHTPAACGEFPPAFAARDEVPPELAHLARKKGRRRAAKGPCPTHGPAPLNAHSLGVCMGCHACAPNREHAASKLHRPALNYDRRKGSWEYQEAERLKAEKKRKADAGRKKKPVRLTARERRQMLRDAKAGDQPLPIVRAFLESIATPSGGPSTPAAIAS